MNDLQLIHFRDDGGAAASSKGKFVLLRHRGTLHICLAERTLAGFHADIVERYCAEHGVPVTRADDRSPAVPGPELQVLGGGRFELDPHRRTLRLYGVSIAYGSFPRAGLRDMLLASGLLPGYTITVDAS
jgi:hypothetical protein